MKTFVGEKYGRYVLIGLEKGDLILESVCQEADRLGIANAIVLSGIGAACRMRYHRIEDTRDDPTDTILTVDGPIEISQFGGMIVDGVPHLHVTLLTTSAPMPATWRTAAKSSMWAKFHSWSCWTSI